MRSWGRHGGGYAGRGCAAELSLRGEAAGNGKRLCGHALRRLGRRWLRVCPQAAAAVCLWERPAEASWRPGGCRGMMGQDWGRLGVGGGQGGCGGGRRRCCAGEGDGGSGKI
jgi:hypothetical protein